MQVRVDVSVSLLFKIKNDKDIVNITAVNFLICHPVFL